MNVWGLPYALAPFKYQVKRLQQLRDKFAALNEQDKSALRPLLERKGAGSMAHNLASRPVAAAQRRRDRFRIPDAFDQHVDAIAAPE